MMNFFAISMGLFYSVLSIAAIVLLVEHLFKKDTDEDNDKHEKE